MSSWNAECLIGFPVSDIDVVVALFGKTVLVDVESRAHVVVVGEFGEVGDSLVGHLQHRHTRSHVPSRSQVLSVLVLQVFLPHHQEQPHVVGAQVAYREVVAAVGIVLDDGGVVGTRVPDLQVRGERVGVGQPHSLLLENCIEELQNLPADEFVVSIHHHHDLLLTAVLQCSSAHVGESISSLFVDDELVVETPFVFPLEEVFQLCGGAVCRGVVDDEDVEVGVVLRKDGPDVAGVAHLHLVVEGGNHDAEAKFRVLVQFVFGAIMLLLLGRELLEQSCAVCMHFPQGLRQLYLLLGYQSVAVVVEGIGKDVLHRLNWLQFRHTVILFSIH